MGERAPYSRVYWSIVDDPKFEAIYGDNDHLATWLRLLITADAIWPASATLPANARRGSIRALNEAGLVDLLKDHRYRVHGLDAERGRRAKAATSRSPNGDQVVPERSPNGPSRARDALLGSSLLSSSRLPEGVQGEPADALDAFYRLTGSWPSPKVLPWLNRLIDAHSDASVSQALGAEWIVSSDRSSILGRVNDRLEREAHEAEKRRQAASVKAAEEERRKIEAMPQEQREANKNRLREMMVKSGLRSPEGSKA
jgi:hypothetical protein